MGARKKTKIGVSFGKVLRDLREAQNLSQEELGFRLGLDRTYVSMLERGVRTPSIGTVFDMARLFDISASEIVARMEEGEAKRR